MANDACIDYKYYNNPRFRLFGGPELPSYSRQLKNIQDQNIKDLPLPLQLAVGDVLSTYDVSQAYNKYRENGNSLKALTTKERSLIRGLAKLDKKGAKPKAGDIIPKETLAQFIRSPELAKSFKMLKEYSPEIGEARTIKNETEIYTKKINEIDNFLKKKINDELDVDDDELTTYIEKLFKAQELETRFLDKNEELTQFTKNNNKQYQEKETYIKSLNDQIEEIEEDILDLSDTTEPPIKEIEERQGRLQELKKELETTTNDLNTYDPTQQPEYLKLSGEASILEDQSTEVSMLFDELTDPLRDKVMRLIEVRNNLFNSLEELKLRYDSIFQKKNIEEKIRNSVKLNEPQLSASSEMLDSIAALDGTEEITTRSGISLTDLNGLFKKVLEFGGKNLHETYKTALNRASAEVVDIAHRINRQTAKTQAKKVDNPQTPKDAAINMTNNVSADLKKNIYKYITGETDLETLMQKNLDNNETLQGKPMFQPPSPKEQNEILDAFAGVLDTGKLKDRPFINEKVMRDEILNRVFKSGYKNAGELKPVLEVLDRENLKYIRANQLQLQWATIKASEAGDRVLELTDESDPVFQEEVYNSLVSWLGVQKKLYKNQQNVMKSLESMKEAVKLAKEVPPEMIC